MARKYKNNGAAGYQWSALELVYYGNPETPVSLRVVSDPEDESIKTSSKTVILSARQAEDLIDELQGILDEHGLKGARDIEGEV